MTDCKKCKEYYLNRVYGDTSSFAKEFCIELWPYYREEKYTIEGIISFTNISKYMIWALEPNVDFDMPKEHEEKLDFILSAKNLDCCIKRNFERFFCISDSRANIMLLPKGKKGVNLNNIKGFDLKYNDFPDLFLEDLQNAFNGELSKLDDVKRWQIYFEQMKCEWDEYISLYEKKWNIYIENNYLQPFYKDNNYDYTKLVKLAPESRPKNYKVISKWHKDGKMNELMDEICIFLINAITVIEKRAVLLSNR